MSRLTDKRSQLNQRGRSVVNYGADLVEWTAEKNLAIAADIASFAVAQIRLTVETRDIPEYLAEVRGSITGLGETLQEHGQDYIARVKELPGDFQAVVKPEIKTSSRKTTVKKKAAAKKGIKTKAA